MVIVGGGFAGAATAYALSRRPGAPSVVLLERERGPGHHASGRNAALGRQLVDDERVTDLTLRGAAFLRDPEPSFSDTRLWSPVGSLLLADSEADARALAGRAENRSIAHERVSMAEAAQRFPLLDGAAGAGGIYVPGDGVIDVHGLLMGYLRGATRRGASVELGAEVSFIERENHGAGDFVVGTRRRSVRARCVVVAGGAWTARVAGLAGARDPGLSPIRRHLLVTAPVPSIDPMAPFVWHLGAREYYARPEGAGLLLSGCDEAITEPGAVSVVPSVVERTAETLAHAAPALAELGVARIWACQRTFTPDRRPLIDWDPEVPGLFWVAGLGGHGATASQAIGEDAATAICNRLGGRAADDARAE